MREKIKRKRGGKEREKGEKIIREKQERGGKSERGTARRESCGSGQRAVISLVLDPARPAPTASFLPCYLAPAALPSMPNSPASTTRPRNTTPSSSLPKALQPHTILPLCVSVEMTSLKLDCNRL